MLHITLALLKKHEACADGYKKLLKHLGGNARKYGMDTPIPLITVLESNGIQDAIWCLRATLPEESVDRDRIARLFAADCAEHVLPIYEARYPNNPAPREAIEVVRRFARGQATTKELRAAAYDAAYAADADAAADAAAYDAAYADAAAYDAAYAADAARAAARAAYDADAADAADAERQWQAARFMEYLDGRRT